MAARAAQANRYLAFMKERAWRDIDFTRFSHLRNPNAAELSLEAIVSRGIAG